MDQLKLIDVQIGNLVNIMWSYRVSQYDKFRDKKKKEKKKIYTK
jgi:hypothetical protein